ncbi:Poly [ADP-ribose] polymerase tankyrase [Gryllus bimaculatus]|nr:Poly [ADP-ribose] polymerase tankyrase [Gryllus bimaculatus]
MGKRKRVNKRVNNRKEDGDKVEEASVSQVTTWDDWWNRKESELEERWRKREVEVAEQLLSGAERAIKEKVEAMAVAAKACRRRQLEEMEELWRDHEAALDAQWRSTADTAVARCTRALEGATAEVLERQTRDLEWKWKLNEAAVEERWSLVVDGEISDTSKAIDSIFKNYCDSSGDGGEKRESPEKSGLEKQMMEASVNLQAPPHENPIEHIKKLLAATVSFDQVACKSTDIQETYIFQEDETRCGSDKLPLDKNISVALDAIQEIPMSSMDVSVAGDLKESKLQKPVDSATQDSSVKISKSQMVDRDSNEISKPHSELSEGSFVSRKGIVMLEAIQEVEKILNFGQVGTDKESITTANVKALSKDTEELFVSQEGSVALKTKQNQAFEMQKGACQQSPASPTPLSSVAEDFDDDACGALREWVEGAGALEARDPQESLSGCEEDRGGSKEAVTDAPGGAPAVQTTRCLKAKAALLGDQRKHIEMSREKHLVETGMKSIKGGKLQTEYEAEKSKDLMASPSSSENSDNDSSEAESTTGVSSTFQKFQCPESEDKTTLEKEGKRIEVSRREPFLEKETKFIEAEKSQVKSEEIESEDLEASPSSNEDNESGSVDAVKANSEALLFSKKSKKSSDSEGDDRVNRCKSPHVTYTTKNDLLEQTEKTNFEDNTSSEEESEAVDEEDLVTLTTDGDNSNDNADQEVKRARDGYDMAFLQMRTTMNLLDRRFDSPEERERTARATASKTLAASPAAARAFGELSHPKEEEEEEEAPEKPPGSAVKDKTSDQSDEERTQFEDRELSEGEMEDLLEVFLGETFLTRKQRASWRVSDAASAFAAAPDAARAQGEQLREASRRRDVQRVLSLRAAGADPDAPDARGETALHTAARAADARNAVGQTALHLAAARGCARCVAQLLSRGADVCAKDMFGRTPLHGAARWGRMAAARALLAAGARTSSEDERGKTPVDLALSRAVADLLKVYEEAASAAK